MKDLLKKGIIQLNLPLQNGALELFEQFTAFMLSYNEKVNLTRIVEPFDIVTKHYLDSLTLLTTAPFTENTEGKKIIDIGCGAGFPSLPIKFMQPSFFITQLDSLNKRIDFLRQATALLHLTGIEQIHGRAEELGKQEGYREAYDFAVSRAVASLPVLSEYCLPFVKPGGYFMAMKGPDTKEETKTANRAIQLLGGTIEEIVSCNIPFCDMAHTIIVIKKISETPTIYPRCSGKISKKPLI